jgi:hypothetical protein
MKFGMFFTFSTLLVYCENNNLRFNYEKKLKKIWNLMNLYRSIYRSLLRSSTHKQRKRRRRSMLLATYQKKKKGMLLACQC